MTKHRLIKLVLVLVNLSLLPMAMAQTTESLDKIRAVAEEFALSQIEDSSLSEIQVKAAALDPRLKLSQCETQLEVFPTSNSGQISRSTVGVKCTGSKPWTLYVPVVIDALAEILVTTRPLLRGETLISEALELKKVPVSKLPLNYLDNPHQLAGMETSRPLKAGTTLTLNAVQPRKIVKQGQVVKIVASGGGVQVQMAGIALKSGAVGDLITVQNNSSGRSVEAEVLNEGTVRVSL